MKFGTIVQCSSSKYVSIDGIEFSIRRHTFKMAAMTSFQAENCCHLLMHTKRPPCAYATASGSSVSIVHSYWFCCLLTLNSASDYRANGLLSDYIGWTNGITG